MSKCLHCQKFDLRMNRDHAKVGLGNCVIGPGERFYGIERDESCKAFVQTDAEAVVKRDVWAEKINAQRAVVV